MEVTPVIKKSFSLLLHFKIALCKMNTCEVVLKSLRASAHSLATHFSLSWNKLRTTPTPPHLQDTIYKEYVSTEEINMVMGQLGIQPYNGHDGSIDILSVFDDEEPSLGEVKVAFDVFDANSDGFIDEFELQRVLCNLGQTEMAKLEECRNMIKGFDVNGDGVIDLDEFVKLMETCSF
ncbi:putative EF-hand domain pair protein CML [Helianthus anomalus]